MRVELIFTSTKPKFGRKGEMAGNGESFLSCIFGILNSGQDPGRALLRDSFYHYWGAQAFMSFFSELTFCV